MRDLLKQYNVEFWTSNNEDIKCALVERFNRTIKGRMYKYFTAQNTKRYIDILPQLVYGYKNTVHRSIGMAPAHVQPQHSVQIRQKLYGKTVKLKKYKYKIGDHVRISKAKRTV